jgi:hypothetical protein
MNLLSKSICRPTLEALEARDLPSTLVVTSVGDTGVRGDGSLRGEIAAARFGDRIVFAPSLAGRTITLEAAKGPLVLNKILTIQGPGAGKLTISGNDATEIFCVAAGSRDTISGLTIARGSADGAVGGGIKNQGTLTLVDCVLSGNHADHGKGHGAGGAIWNNGRLLLEHCTLTGNHADDPSNSAVGGGAIFNFGSASLEGCTLVGNHANNTLAGGGGAIADVVGTLTIDNSILRGNTTLFGDSSQGGAIFHDGGTLTVLNSTLSGNEVAGLAGGAIVSYGTATLEHCTLVGNTCNCGGAKGAFGGGALWSSDGSKLAVIDCTVARNSATGTFSAGGGILNLGTLSLEHSTVSGNHAGYQGGGIWNKDGTTSLLEQPAVFGNTAPGGPNVFVFSGRVIR